MKSDAQRSTRTDQFSGFVRALIDEIFEGIFENIREFLIVVKTFVQETVELLLEVQQIVDHLLVFVHVDDQSAATRLARNAMNDRRAHSTRSTLM